MRLTRRLYERFRVLIHEAAKFGVVGLVGFIVSLGGADVLHFGAGMGKYTAIVIATVAATVVTFVGNRYWAFRHRERTGMGRETVMFFVFNGIGLLIQLACVAIVQDGANLTGQALVQRRATWSVSALGTLFRFWSYRKWVWTAADAPAAPVLSTGSPRRTAPRTSRRSSGRLRRTTRQRPARDTAAAASTAAGPPHARLTSPHVLDPAGHARPLPRSIRGVLSAACPGVSEQRAQRDPQVTAGRRTG